MIGALSIVVGSVPVGVGLYGPWVALLIGAAMITAVVFGLGEAPPRTSSDKKDE